MLRNRTSSSVNITNTSTTSVQNSRNSTENTGKMSVSRKVAAWIGGGILAVVLAGLLVWNGSSDPSSLITFKSSAPATANKSSSQDKSVTTGMNSAFNHPKPVIPAVDLLIRPLSDPSSTISQYQRDGEMLMDACRFLGECFPASYFGDRMACHSNLRETIEQYDSGFLRDRASGQLIGFISGHWKKLNTPSGSDKGALLIYNVCVAEEARGFGYGKFLVNDFITRILAQYNATESFVGLDVDLETGNAPSVLAMYAKMGFLRWWEPCPSIGYFDFTKLTKSPSTTNNAFANYWMNRESTLQSAYTDQLYLRGRLNRHFCMIKRVLKDSKYSAEDFKQVGGDLKERMEETRVIFEKLWAEQQAERQRRLQAESTK